MKMKKIYSLFLAGLCAFSLIGCGSQSMESSSNDPLIEESENEYIVKNGNTEYSIIIPEQYSETEYFAATELSAFVKESTGAEMAIEYENEYDLAGKHICIGNLEGLSSKIKSDIDTLGTDGFVMVSQNNSIFIVGENECGTLYGVYDFIERVLGVRFIADDCTYVPETKDVAFYNLDVKDSPSIPKRYYMAGGASGDTGKLSLYHARIRLQSNYGSNEAYGGSSEWCIEAGMSHNVCVDVVKPSEWEETHPEFFYHEHGLTDICWSNGLTDAGEVDQSMDVSVFKVALNDLKKYAEASNETNKNVNLYMFGHWDVGAGNKGCQCDRCKLLQEKYGYSGMTIRFVNKLAEELNKWSLETLNKPAYVIAWAYHISAMAPVKESETSETGWEPIDETVRANENVVIYYAPIEANRNYALLDENQKIDVYNNVSKWKSVASNFVLWTYDVNFSNYMIYFPRLHTYQEDTKLFEEMGAKYIQVQASWDTDNVWHTLMMKYVAAKLMWDPDLDVNALKKEFVDIYYGPAKGYINELIRRYEEMWCVLEKQNPSFVMDHNNMDQYLANNAATIMLGLQDLCDQGIEEINKSSLSDEEKEVYINRVLGVKFTFMFQEMRQYESYHHNSTLGRYELAVEVFALAEKLGIQKYREGTNIETLRSTYLG